MVRMKKSAVNKATDRNVVFVLEAPDAGKVVLSGDFNGWSRDKDVMKKDSTGLWRTDLKLKPGRYEYKLIVDGSWQNDPLCCNCMPNPFGSQNCIVEVG